jgi:hypothetical protein
MQMSVNINSNGTDAGAVDFKSYRFNECAGLYGAYKANFNKYHWNHFLNRVPNRMLYLVVKRWNINSINR